MNIEKLSEKVETVFQKYQEQIQRGENINWAEFDQEIISRLQRSSEIGTRDIKGQAGYQVVKKIIIHFHNSKRFNELCEEYAKVWPSGEFDMEGI